MSIVAVIMALILVLGRPVEDLLRILVLFPTVHTDR
jgi:hypothetical protein